MSKTITVPQQTIEFDVENPVTFEMIKVKFDFKKFALRCVHTYDFFGQGLDNILQGAEIVKAIENCKKTLKLGQSNYDKFWKAVEARKWSPPAAQACVPFIVAVKEAKEDKEG